MNSRDMINNDFCLLSNIYLNSERIFYLLEYRFKSNSCKTSFDFKSFLPEQLSNNIKISHSLSNFYPRIIKSINNDDENVSSESSEDEIEQISSPKSSINLADDDYLDKLAEWEPNTSSQPILESDDDEEEIENNIHVDPTDSSTEMPSNQVEDVLVTFVHYPVKTEPMINLPQLDGQTDFLFNNKQSIDENIHSHQQFSSSQPEKSVWEHMILAEQKLNTFRIKKTNTLYPTQPKIFPSINASIKKKTRSNNKLNQQSQTKNRSRSKSKKLLSMGQCSRTLFDYFKVVKRLSTNDNIQYSPVKKQQNESSINKIKSRSDSYFDQCIVIEDDDIQEIQQQQRSSISNNIHTREKLLDHAVHSSEMRIKWLLNVELILLEHISIYHQENSQSFYHINSSFISIIILNFLKIFIIRNSHHDQDEFSFYQFSLTSYLRYLLIDLPTYKHQNLTDENNCFECKQYSLILNILFDLLFDLIEYDICEIYDKEKYRSSLIQDDYFNQLKINKKNPFYRIKLIIYFIELIGIHRNKCSNKKEEESFFSIENKIFQWIEHIIYQINNLKNERISLCFNVMELSLLFINEKENYVKQMVMFLMKLCEENLINLDLVLFNKNLLPDIRLLLINEFISNKFNIKFISIDYIEEFFHRIKISLIPPNPIDDTALLLIRSLFDAYADLMIDLKHFMLMSSSFSERIITLFRNELESIYLTLINLSHDSNYFEQIKRTVIFFRLLKCKWNRL